MVRKKRSVVISVSSNEFEKYIVFELHRFQIVCNKNEIKFVTLKFMGTAQLNKYFRQ